MTRKTFVVVHFDETVWQLLDSLNEPKQDFASSKLRRGTNVQPPLILVECEKVEDTTYGFLRLVPAAAEGNQPVAVSVPIRLIAAILETGMPLPPGFLGSTTSSDVQ